MNKLTNAFYEYPRAYITDGELATLLGGTPNSRYSKVKRLIAEGKLLHIRRGLYCLTAQIGYTIKPHPFELAQPIYGPSYISLESALSFHGLIPEAVYTITNVTTKRKKEFHTPLGVFSYQHLPAKNFYMEVEIHKEDSYQFFIANPWKAICDFVFCYKKNWDSLTPLSEDLRIDCEKLPLLQEEQMHLLNEYYHHSRITCFLHGIKKLI